MEIVYYDLETTGLNPSNKQKGIQIVEIGAISCSEGHTFQQYILPTTPIPPEATGVHGLFLKKKEDGSGFDWTNLYMKKKGGGSRRVEAVDKVTGLKRFLHWLGTFQTKVTLAGYNSHNFDDWVLCHELQGVAGKDAKDGLHIHKLADVAKIVRPVLREKLKTRKWSLGFAVKNLLRRRQEMAHGALSDAVDARDLLKEVAHGKNVTTKGALVDNERAWIQFDDIWVACFNMMSSKERKLKCGSQAAFASDGSLREVDNNERDAGNLHQIEKLTDNRKSATMNGHPTELLLKGERVLRTRKRKNNPVNSDKISDGKKLKSGLKENIPRKSRIIETII